MTTYRLFPSTSGPGAVTTASGGWLLGVAFSVTGGARWFDGYWIWNPANGDTTARKCALWTCYGSSSQSVVPNSVVTSGAMTQGAWNYVPLSTPVLLGPGTLYVAAIGWNVTSGIPLTSTQFDSGDTYANGITNGFLTAWSTGTGSNPYPTPNFGVGQMVFSNVLGSDPSVNMPNNASSANNLWVDVQVSDTAPAGYSGTYRFWPNTLDLGNFSLDTANGFTLGLEFSISQTCTLDNGWFYSPATVSVLPTSVAVYRVSDQSIVAVNNSPSWSGAAGSGWVSAPFTGTLPAGQYKYVVFQGANSIWNAAVASYWSTGFGANGLVSGPMTAPNNASATSPGQESYHQAASITFPDTNAGPYHYGLDVEVTPVASSVGYSLPTMMLVL